MDYKDTVMPKESIIILSYANPEMIEAILQALLEEQAKKSFEAGMKECAKTHFKPD